VPKPTTKASIVILSCAASGAVAISRSSGCSTGDAEPAMVANVASVNVITPIDAILIRFYLRLGARKSAGLHVSLEEGYITDDKAL
jgi:Na+-driven multidrug efflux pump